MRYGTAHGDARDEPHSAAPVPDAGEDIDLLADDDEPSVRPDGGGQTNLDDWAGGESDV